MASDYLYILQGDSYQFSTNICVDNVATNLYGSSVWMYAKGDPEEDGDTEAIFSASTNNGEIAISGANNSIVTVTLNSNVTENYTQCNVFHWGLRCQTAGGLVYTLARGLGAVMTPTVRKPY